ncbi:MAG: hypothetical protein VX404_08100 [Planctomycetota bacterium]|nr:hypothetical protein [Planctomycetota bacterium]
MKILRGDRNGGGRSLPRPWHREVTGAVVPWTDLACYGAPKKELQEEV